MKFYFNPALLFLTLCIAFSVPVHSQNDKTIEQVIEAINNADVFIKNRKFKSDFESFNVELGKKLLTYDDYETLNIAYNEVHDKYNSFLTQIKKDLSDYDQIKKMVKRPQRFASQYLEDFNEVMEVYEDDYLPIAEDIERKFNSETRSLFDDLTPDVIKLGFRVFDFIVGVIKGRREEKNESLNTILSIINQQFYNKLRMRDWAELDIKTPKDNLTNSPLVGSHNSPDSDFESIATADKVEVVPPYFEDLNGWLEFNHLNDAKNPERMLFSPEVTRDIILDVKRVEKGKIKHNEVKNHLAFFSSIEKYSDGTQFQMKTFNTAGMYVFTQNSDGSISFLYPFDKDQNFNCDQSTRDITVLPIQGTFAIGKNRNNVTTLPSQDCAQRPPLERYFTLQGAHKGKETFCVLLTRSELDIEDIRRTLSRTTGTMQDRLAVIFGDKLISPENANLAFQDNRLTFSSFEKGKTVLPLVFYIFRD